MQHRINLATYLNFIYQIRLMEEQKITIIRITRRLKKGSVNMDIQWLGNSLGLFSQRDKDKSCYRIFVELLKASKTQEGLTSDNIAYHLNLSRGTVIHHINRLIDSGIVVSQKNKYMLRMENLEILLSELERDIERAFEDMKEIAKKIDKELGL